MSKIDETTVILGGNGKTGARVAARLEALGVPVRRASRSTPVCFDWHDEATWGPALRGARKVYMTYHPDLAVPGASEHVEAVTKAAVHAGVERIVLLAGRGEPQVHPAEEVIRRSGVEYTILECAFFSQNFSESLLVPIDGKITFPAGDVTEPFIDCDDIADIAVAALTEGGHVGKTYDLTGPELLTFAEATAVLSDVSRRKIDYVRVSYEEYETLVSEHLGAATARFLCELFRAVLDGHNSHVTNEVPRLLGRPARRFADYARDVALVQNSTS